MAPKPSIDKLIGTARKAAKDQDWIRAVEGYAAVLSRFPSNAKAKRALQDLRPTALPALLAQAQREQGTKQWAEAARSLSAAALLAPAMPEVLIALAACQLELGAAPDARKTAGQVLKIDPRNVQALNYKGRAEREMGLNGDAMKSFQAALDLQPDNAATLNNLGITARAGGDRAAAAAYYERALAVDPESAEVHRNLAQVTRYTADHPHLQVMRDLAAGPVGKRPSAAPLHFALFKALDEAGQSADAFEHLTTANRAVLQRDPYDFQSDALSYAMAKSLMPEARAVDAGPDMSPRPIFVLGLPRSGTTLVERILTRDPKVQAGGELPVVQAATSRMLKSVMGRDDKRVRDDDLLNLRAEIIAGFAAYTDGRPVIIDKTPLNFRWSGLIAAALPEARIVHLARDPMGVAWSLYRLSFAGRAHGFVYDPVDIAKYMVLHRSFMAHWTALYPERIFHLDYETLIAEPEAQTRALAAATGLDWTEDWLHPEKATNQVLTASADQVRRPMYKGSNDQWRRYEAELKPLRDALREAGILDAG